MKILSLTLKNFKGIKSFTLDTRGGNTSVYGDNATGKTTLADALYWLLFDKDSQNRKDFDIKTITPDGQVVHGLEHSVEGIFDIGGQKLTLKKVFTEKWTKKRGGAEKQFTGHTTDHYIDGVPVKKKEYTDRVSEIADEEIFKLLTSPTYFNTQLHWQERRNILLQVCGDVSDQEVIESDKDLAKLPDILQGRKLEDHRKVIAARRSEINKELERIPVRIDEVQQSLPDISNIDPEETAQKIAIHKKSIKEKEQQISRIESGGEIAEKTKELREIEGKLLELKSQHRAQYDTKIQDKQEELSQARERAFSLKSDIKGLERTLYENNNNLTNLQSRMENLRNQWHEVNNQEFSHTDTCPTCGQSLPEEKIEDARAHFNREKAEKLEKITAEGKELKAQADELESENAGLEKRIRDARDQLEKQENIVIGIQDEIEKLRQQAEQYTESEQYQNMLRVKEAIEEDIAHLKDGRQDEIKRIQNSIVPLENEIRLLESQLNDIERSKQGQMRIEELSQQEKQLAAEFEKLEQELYLTEQFIRSKVNLLEEKINSKFKYARFKMFDQQINGGLVETCETLYQGVPYGSSLNNAARINVGLDIINTLSDFYNFYPPIFIDNREAVTQLIDARAQVISLVVSEPDKELRVEYESDQISQREAS